MSLFGKSMDFLRRRQKPDIGPTLPPEQAELNSALDEAIVLAQNADDQSEKTEIDEEDDVTLLRNPGFKWPLIRNALAFVEEYLEEAAVNVEEFRGYKGFIVNGFDTEGKKVRNHTFNSGVITNDLQHVAEIEEVIHEENEDEKNNRKYYRRERNESVARVAEGILAYKGKEIFGDDAEIVPMSKIGDFGGVDHVVVFRDADGKIDQMIAIDVTTGSSQKTVNKKFVHSLAGIIKGTLSTILYISSKNNKGEKEYFSARGVPRATIGISRHSTMVLAKRLLSESLGGKKTEVIDRERRASILWGLLEQIRGQRIISEINDKTGKPPFAVTSALEKAEKKILSIIHANGLGYKVQKQHKDRCFRRIRDTALGRGKQKELMDLARKWVQELNERKHARRLTNRKRGV